MTPEAIFKAVMAGLDPAIHVLIAATAETWMPGTKPGVAGMSRERTCDER